MSDILEARLEALEARIGNLEDYVIASVAPRPVDNSKTPRPQPIPHPSKRPPPLPAGGLTSTQPTEAKPGNWLGIVGILCFILAAGFIVKLSIETGWLTPAKQLGIAALLGIGLIGAGLALMSTDREYASLLPGGGVIVLYLTVFAAHRFYGLISPEVAIALVTVVSAVCIWLYTIIKHDIYAITAAVGTYVSPVFFGLNVNATFTLYYFLLCSAAFATISIWVRARTLTLVSSYLALAMSAAIGFTLNNDMLVASVLALQFLIFTTGTFYYTKQTRIPLTVEEAWSFLPVLLAFYALEYHFIDRIQPGLAPWVSLCFAGVLMGLYLTAKKYFPESLGSQSLVLAFTTIVCFHSVYLQLLPDLMRPWLFVIIMLIVAFSPKSLPAKKKNSPFFIPFLAVMAILVIEYLSMLADLLDGGRASSLLVSCAAFASIWCVIVKPNPMAQHERFGHTLLIAAHLLAIMGLYRLTTDVGSLAVSISWLCYAVGVMVFAFNRKDEVMAKSALFVLAFAAGKALIYDASSAPTVVRIFCLLFTGAVLYGCGLLMRKISGWKIAR